MTLGFAVRTGRKFFALERSVGLWSAPPCPLRSGRTLQTAPEPDRSFQASAADLQELTAQIVGLLEDSLNPAVPPGGKLSGTPITPADPPAPGPGQGRTIRSRP